MNFKLKIWRQAHAGAEGKFVSYQMKDISPDTSFLEMLDLLNENLELQGQGAVAFDHDSREGICGMCSLYINGEPHGPLQAATTCQIHMRSFRDGETIVVEPWRARALPIVKDLAVDRSAFDRIMEAGGFISARSGSAPDANAMPIRKESADLAFDAAACIGCAACVAACKNASAMLFVAAKVGHLAQLPQGQPERQERVLAMVETMEKEGFGACSNEGECEAACPKEISVEYIARLNREYLYAAALHRPKKSVQVSV